MKTNLFQRVSAPILAVVFVASASATNAQNGLQPATNAQNGLQSASTARNSSSTGAQNSPPPYALQNAELDALLNVDREAAPDDYVRVVYFHREPGCANCQKMARYVFELVRDRFAAEARGRRIVLRYYDFDDPKNAKLVAKFKVASPSLWLIQGRGGVDVKAKKADKIWSLCGDKKAFLKYVDSEIRAYLPSKTPTSPPNAAGSAKSAVKSTGSPAGSAKSAVKSTDSPAGSATSAADFAGFNGFEKSFFAESNGSPIPPGPEETIN